MSDEYTVRVNRSDGVVEVTGPDKDWVSEKLEKLAFVFETTPPDRSEPATPPREEKRPGTSAHRSPGPRTSRRGSGRAEKNEELSRLLTKDAKGRLEEYVTARKSAWDKSQPAQAAIVATFLQDELDWRGVDHHDLYTVYTEMGYPIPGNLRSQLVNARQRAKYFHGIRDGKYELSHSGENFGRHGSVGAPADDAG